jgi:tRNA(Ile2)-agmatinylcytidine synthase
MGWLGLDDTDSLSGGCTTEVFHRLLNELPTGTWVGQPRLIRLWPFAQRRTRGNAALAVELDVEDTTSLLEHLDRWWTSNIFPLAGSVQPSDISSRKQSPASPGMVWFDEKPDSSFYWAAVRGDVTDLPLPPASRRWGGHGCIGASAAVAWPAMEVTWEAIAWRQSGANGPRSVDESALNIVDGLSEVVFCRDPRRGKQLVAPRGVSPVLFGIRALTLESASHACLTLLEAENTEATAGWRVFETNQASGDHLQGTLPGTVEKVNIDPVRKHVTLTLQGKAVVKVFAEGGPVNALARWLKPGDTIEVRGLRHPDGSLHAEQMRCMDAVTRAVERPQCSACGRRMKSMGANQGVRCPGCKLRAEDAWVDVPSTPPYDGWVEPNVDGRRHLARPLSWSKTP